LKSTLESLHIEQMVDSSTRVSNSLHFTCFPPENLQVDVKRGVIVRLQ